MSANKLGLTEIEESQLKTVCEYLFFDQFHEHVSYARFEQCLQPLLNEANISLYTIFKEICGPKKKYLNYPRFVNAYKKYKLHQNQSNDLKIFFDKLFNDILMRENTAKGESPEICFRYSTKIANRKRGYISLIEVLVDNEDIIHGLTIEYDGVFKNRMYPSKLEQDLSVSLEMNLGIIDEQPIIKGSIGKFMGIKEKFFRDVVTHVFGTFDKETKTLSFLGFKCASGKTVFVGFPKGDGFLFGKFETKLSQFKIEMTEQGVTKLEPIFDQNMRPNFYLKRKANQLNESDLNKNEFILDEDQLTKLTNEDEIDKFITTPVVSDDKFFNKKLQDIISGNDYKEVVNQDPRKWIMNKRGPKLPPGISKIPTLNDALNTFEQERKKRGMIPKGGKGGQMPNISKSFFEHTKKKLDFFKGPKGRPPRMFGPKGFDPNIFESTLAGFAAPHGHPHGGGMHGPHPAFPHGQFIMNQQGQSKGFNQDPNKNSDIPHPLCPDCKKLFGLKGSEDTEKLRYYGNNYGTNYGYNYNQKYNYNYGYNTKYNYNYGYNYNYNNYYNNNYYPSNNKYNYNYNVEQTKKEEKKYDNILIPDVNPEKVTSLTELETQLKGILTLLENKNISPTDRKKLEQLKNLYLQQKNILIENETKKAQEEINNSINVNKYVKEEEERRKKEKEEEDKNIENAMNQEKVNNQTTTISTQNAPDPKKIYKNQEMYKGSSAWTDPMFKPEKSNLCPYDKNGKWVLPEDVLDSDIEGWDKFKWARAEDIFDSQNYKIFDKGSIADDIIQGNIGDCYFLSAIGALCKFPKLIDRLFYFRTKTKQHLYGIYIFINGLWELVLIDDYFPYSGSYFKQFAFGSSREDELWLCLLEKAWAKINGCYAKIGCGGTPNEVFDVLTEAYSEYYTVNKNNKDDLWKKMIDAKQKGYVMTAGTSGDVYNLPIEEMGLSPGHAYTVLDLHEINGEKVMRLRNPWGNGEYSGDWSDSSKKWTAELKKKYGLVNKDDGDFYMSYDDYLKYYAVMGFGKIYQDYVTRVIRIEKTEAVKCQVLKLDVPQDKVHAFLQLYQKNPRIILNDGTYQQTVLCYLILVDSNFNYIDSMSTKDMHICVEQTLNKGTYYLLSDLNYRYCNTNGKNHGYNVTSYAQVPITLSNITSQVDVNTIMHKAMVSFCKKEITPSKKSNGLNIYTYKEYTKQLPFMVTGYENTTNNYFVTETEVKGKGDKTFCIYCDNYASEDETTVTKPLPPKSMTCVIILKYSNSTIFSCSSGIAPSSAQEAYELEKEAKNKAKTNTTVNTNTNTNKATTNVVPSNSIDNNPVFKTEGEEIDEDGYLIQYLLQGSNNSYVIGLENTSNYRIALSINLEGLDILDNAYKGKSKPSFIINAKEKKVFNVKVKSNYSGNVSFQFEYE